MGDSSWLILLVASLVSFFVYRQIVSNGDNDEKPYGEGHGLDEVVLGIDYRKRSYQ